MHRTLIRAADGLLLATLYCVAYLTAWFHSLDQWLLPVGLRAAVLLLIPRRWIWAWALGDVAAMYLMRIPRAGFDGTVWAWVSPLLVGPSFAVLPLILRRWLRSPAQVAAWLPLIAPACGLWSWACSWAISLIATSPNAFADLTLGATWSLGSALGVLVMALPPLLWRTYSPSASWLDSAIARDSTLCCVVVAAIVVAVAQTASLAPTLRIGLLVLAVTPAVAMTFAHGWRGAAVGALAANLGIGLTLPDFQREGAVDGIALVAQQVTLVASLTLLALGEAISRHRARALDASNAAIAALAQIGRHQRITERSLREQLLLLARMQAHVDEGRRALVDWLREHAHFSAALDLNRSGVEHRSTFDAYATALYPLSIEHEGLYRVIVGETFSRFWVGATPVRYQLRGEAWRLSLDLQLSAYRALCACFVVLSDATPRAYAVQMRAWRRGHRQGVVLRVRGIDGAREEVNSAAMADLEQRARAHGGRARRHALRVILDLPETIPEDGISRASARPPTGHRQATGSA